MLYSKRTEELNKKYNEYLKKFDEYSEKIHSISSRLRELKQQLNNEFIYEGFNCIVKSEEIKYKSLIMQDKKDNRRLYILINSNLSIDDAINEVEYVKNNMLPGVINTILNQEQLEREKEEKELKNLKFRGLDFETVKDIFWNSDKYLSSNEVLSIDEVHVLSKMLNYILDSKDQTSVFCMMSFLTYELGVIEGRKQRNKGVVVND